MPNTLGSVFLLPLEVFVLGRITSLFQPQRRDVAHVPVAAAVALPETNENHPPERHSQLVSFLELSPTPTVIVDPALRITVGNRAFDAMTGVARSEIAGRPIVDLLDESGREWLERQFGNHAGPVDGTRLGRVCVRAGADTEMLVVGAPLFEHDVLSGWWLRFETDPDRVLTDPSIQGLAERMSREKERLAALLNVSHAVVNSLDLDIILATIAQEVRQVIAVDECTVYLIAPDGETLTPAVSDSERHRDQTMRTQLRVGEGVAGAAALDGRGVIVNSGAEGSAAAGAPGGNASLMCVPLIAREQVLGVITLARLGAQSFDPADLELVTLFAGQCSAALANSKIYDELRAAYDELREAQAQLVQSAKLNALGEMAAGVAHDFNNLLAAILGRTEILLREVKEPGLRRQLQVVQQAALDGAHSVHRVQEFTRIRHDEHFAGLSVNTLITDVVELTRTVWETDAKKRGIPVHVHQTLAATQIVAGNASELREVFTNLILNAVDAMPQGGDLYLSTRDEGDEVVVRVRDTGIGMDAQTRARMFEPFFTTKPKGTGLGLSLAYGIITRHRGSIGARSQPEAGTEFVLRFPSSLVPAAAAPPAVRGPAPCYRVLVVDDEEAVRSVLADLLQALGQDVSTAAGGREGIERIDHTPVDVVITDLGMPEINGWDVAAAIRARHPETVIVMATGWASQLDLATAQSRGVDIILPKPFLIDDVERVLHEAAGPRALRNRAA